MQNLINIPTRFFYWILPLALGSSTLFADTIKLSENSAWDFGIQALYLKTSFSDGFAFLEDTTVNLNTDKRNALKLNWGWGFKLEGSYHFCPNSDLNLNLYHYKKSTKGSFVFRANPTADVYTVTPDWDAVNLELGESIHLNEITNLRLHGGLQYAQMKTKYHSHGTDPIRGPGIERDMLKYSGVGPRMGVDMSVGLIKNGISAYFGGDVAMLVGRSKFTFKETFLPHFSSGSRPTDVVPEIGLKIGARYDYAIPCGDVVFDLGYMFVNYFNALNFHDDFNASETNFALNGLYVGVKLILG